MDIELFPLLRHSDLYRTKVPLSEIESLLSTFRLTDVMLRLGQINLLFAKGRNEDHINYVQGIFISNFFDESTIGLINEKYSGRSKNTPVFFSRLQTLVLTRLAAQVCSDSSDKRAIHSLEEKLDFGRCCLWITDHFETEEDVKAISEGPEDDRRRTLAPQIATSRELSSPGNTIRLIARADILFSDIAKSSTISKKCRDFDLFGAFLSVTGISIDHFQDFVLFVYTGFEVHTIQKMIDDTSLFVIHPQKFISKTEIDDQNFEKFTKLISIPIDRVPEELKVPLPGTIHRNFSAINSRPLLALANGTVICLDFDYLTEKLSTGVYWTIVDHFSGQDKGKAQGMLGYIFEEYVNSIFCSVYKTHSSPLSGHFTESPKYSGASIEAFDAMYLSRTNPRHLFVFQYKSNYIKPNIKYGSNVDDLERELDEKFGRGKGAGVEQLIRNIESVWHEDKSQRRALAWGPVTGIDKITPVLVVQENFFISDFFNWILNKWFQELRAKANIDPTIHVDPLMVVHIDDLERLQPYLKLGVCTFEGAINSLVYDDPERLASFSRHLYGFLQRQFGHLENTDLVERFSAVMDRARSWFREECDLARPPNSETI